MGIRVTVGEYVFEAADYSVHEEATPLAAGDASGAVSTINLTIPMPHPDVPLDTERTGAWFLRKYGPDLLRGMPMRLDDSRRGFIVGTVEDVTEDVSSRTVELVCLSKLGDLAVFNVRALPFAGSLYGAFAYYLSLAGITDEDEFFVDPSIANRQVAYVGWVGELWYHLKMMAAAQDCDITLVSGIITLRPIRSRVADGGRTMGLTRGTSTERYAQAVEVYNYNTSPINNDMIYPPRGREAEVEVLTATGGEISEYIIDLGASVHTIYQPVPVLPGQVWGDGNSAYVVTDDDGNVIDPGDWTAYGGNVEVILNEDTTSATVRVVGAALPLSKGGSARTYSLGFRTSDGVVPMFRLRGSGVRFSLVKQTYRSGVTDAQTATPVGVTIDNPFITSNDIAGRMGSIAARRAARRNTTVSGSVVSISKRGDTGSLDMPTYDEVMAELRAAVGAEAPTWEQARAYYEDTLGVYTYGELEAYYRERQANSFDEQVFGNVQGARYWDKERRRWYRIRSATITPGEIQFEADDDVTVDDMQALFEGKTYAEVQAIFEGMSYRQVDTLGMYDE